LEALGGSLSVEVSAQNVNYGECDYLSFPLYTRLSLRDVLPTGEPTAVPSGQPFGRPSLVPTGEPSAVPSGEPSGDPSAAPSCSPTVIPSSEPSSEPSTEPSAAPTGHPSAAPSGQPSIQPSAHPTLYTPFLREYVLGGNNSHPAVFQLNNLGFGNRYTRNNESMFLSVSVFPTDYAQKANQWATVKLNGEVIRAYCTPDESCGRDWFSCVVNLNVSGVVSPANGGSLDVEVSSFGVRHSECDVDGFPLLARVVLTESTPSDVDAISVYYFLYATGGFFIVALVALLVHVYITKEKNIISKFIKEVRERRRQWLYDADGNRAPPLEVRVLNGLSRCAATSKLKMQQFFFPPRVLPDDDIPDLESASGSERKAIDEVAPWKLAVRREDSLHLSNIDGPRANSSVQGKTAVKPFVLADMDLLLMRSRSMAKVHPIDWSTGDGDNNSDNAQQLQHQGEKEDDGGFIETLQSWDHMDEEHERKLMEEGKQVNIMSQYRQLGRVSTMSWLLNNDIDA